MRSNGQNLALRAAVAFMQRIPTNDRHLAYVRPRIDDLLAQASSDVTVHDFDGSTHLDVEFIDDSGNSAQVTFRDSGLFFVSLYDEARDAWVPAHVSV